MIEVRKSGDLIVPKVERNRTGIQDRREPAVLRSNLRTGIQDRRKPAFLRTNLR